MWQGKTLAILLSFLDLLVMVSTPAGQGQQSHAIADVLAPPQSPILVPRLLKKARANEPLHDPKAHGKSSGSSSGFNLALKAPRGHQPSLTISVQSTQHLPISTELYPFQLHRCSCVFCNSWHAKLSFYSLK